MTDDRTLERAARSWLEAGPTQAPDHAVDAALDRITTTTQERDLRIPRRFPKMKRLIIPAAAALVAVVAAVALMPRLTSAPVGVSPSPPSEPVVTATPAPSFSSAPRTAISVDEVGRTLPAGAYRVDSFAVAFTVTLPAGWSVAEVKRNNVVLHSDSEFLTVVVMDGVYPDPCHPDGPAKPFGPRLEDFVAALGSMADFRLDNMRDATVGSASAKAFTLTNSIDMQANDCSDPDVLTLGTYDWEGMQTTVIETPDSADPVWVVDAAGTPVLIGGPSAIVETMEFGEPSPEPSPAFAAGSLDATYVSRIYGYSVEYPSIWTSHPASKPAVTIDNSAAEADELDCSGACGAPSLRSATFRGLAGPAPGGLSPKAWVFDKNRAECKSVLGGDTVTIDGLTGLVVQGGCQGLGHSDYAVLVPTETLVYRFQLSASSGAGPAFLEMLSTVQLDPPPAGG